jgi:hypothetical protein
MGMPARRTDGGTRAASRTPRLRLVEPARRAPAAGRAAAARGRAAEARAKAVFSVFVTLLIAAAVLGGARVTLIVRATEVSMGESKLQADIKAERVVADQLEVDRSSLSTPSRIAGIASTTMDMGTPLSVHYITLGSHTAASSPAVASATDVNVASSSSGLSDVVSAVVHMSAGEAQSLLVGDLGLAGSR